MAFEDFPTLEELALKYEVEPTIRDVFVEGPFDAAMVQWILQIAGCQLATVFDINDIKVDTDSVLQHGLSDGNRGRVITLCLELESSLSDRNQLTGIVDKDFDEILFKSVPTDLVLTTDNTCTEMYLLDEYHFFKFAAMVLHKGPEFIESFNRELVPILRDLYLIRATNISLGLNLHWLDPVNQVRITKREVRFSPEDFVTKYLNKSAMHNHKKQFLQELDRLRSIPFSSSRDRIHGHDFTSLLGKYISVRLNWPSFADPSIVERSLSACLDYGTMVNNIMFKSLLLRVC